MLSKPKQKSFSEIFFCCFKQNVNEEEIAPNENFKNNKKTLDFYEFDKNIHNSDKLPSTHQNGIYRLTLPSHAEIEFEEEDVEPGYARLIKTPKHEHRKLFFSNDQSSRSSIYNKKSCSNFPNFGDSCSSTVSATPIIEARDNKSEEMMIATVHPFSSSKSTTHNSYNNKNNSFKIEDVTDNPKYKEEDNGEKGLEGSLIEYCRLDSKQRNNSNKPYSKCNVFEADTAVKARINHVQLTPSNWHLNSSGGEKKSNLFGLINGFALNNNGTSLDMAHVIDVEVGQPCSQMSKCNCYGFRPHTWRKVCVHCKCDRSEHELDSKKALQSIYERLGIKPNAEMTAIMSNQHNDVGSVGHGYAWVPPGLSRVKIEEYMAQLPNHIIPRVNSIGEKNREKQLMLQLPRQDLSISYCKHLKTPVERRFYDEFVNARNELSLDIGFVSTNLPKTTDCQKCKGILDRNEMAVIAPKLGENASAYHPACFVCEQCQQLLVDLTYCVRDDKIYCERHFAELHKPRCSACDELIFSSEYTKAMNKDWHSDHFCCWQCDSTLTGQRYILRDEHPYCIKCYEEIFANTCDECGKHIGIDSKDLSYKEKHWHEDCFLCNMCKISLVDKPFGSKNDRIFCSNCYDQAFATRCDGCNEIFRAGMKKMEYKGKQWHDNCFCCASCKAPIGTKSFIPKNEEIFCANCYEEKFATRCCKCKKVITTGGVTYKNEPWHRECFCCTNCNTSLAGQRFTSKDEKPYCADCYGELFAKRCSACVKPITGIGGAKFISFEDRHWHNDCFICAQCTTTLVGKGFITDGADILCPECAKARLMAANS